MIYNTDPQKGGIKHDIGKLMVELVPPEALEELAKVLTAGAKKYEPRNWEKGMSWTRVYGALQRHLLSWSKGESIDPEYGLPHLSHALACLSFLVVYEKRGIGQDDRPKLTPTAPATVCMKQDRIKNAHEMWVMAEKSGNPTRHALKRDLDDLKAEYALQDEGR